MKIIPLAFDSLGTRSMATYVETKDSRILIDPSVSLAPERFGLPPHPKEIERMGEHWMKIKEYAKKAEILIITHYHYDHHSLANIDIYKGKVLFIKNPKEKINLSQTKRSKLFLENIEGLPKEIIYSDATEHSFSRTNLKFSPPVSHGMHDRLGYVTEALIDDGKKLIHTSDVLGPCTEEQAKFIIDEQPDILFTDGPLNFTLRPAVKNLKKIIKECSIEKLVIDHHLLRDLGWRDKIAEVFSAGEGKTEVMCAAEYAGKKEDLLEARRKQLYFRD